MPEYKFINLFRAIAAAWVLIAHVAIWTAWPIHLPDGKLAVNIFMVISGFLMMANVTARQHKEPMSAGHSMARFWARRFFRIAPLYYLVLLVTVLCQQSFLGGYAALQALAPQAWPSGGPYDPAHFSYDLLNIGVHLSFLFGLLPDYAQSTFLPDWSLSLEMQFYLIFPFLFLALQKRSSWVYFLLGFCVFVAGYFASRHLQFPEPSLLLFGLNYFIAGMLLFKAQAMQRLDGKLAWREIFFATVLVSLDRRYGFQLALLPCCLIAMAALATQESGFRRVGGLAKFLDSRLIHLASNTSYAVYLVHGFFLSSFGLTWMDWFPELAHRPDLRFSVALAYVVVASYACAYLAYRYIELPGIALGQRLLAIKKTQGSLY